MNTNDYYSKRLSRAKTVSIKGHILESNDKFIVIIPCFCVHHDPPNHPCPCMQETKLIIERSDIVGEITTVTSEDKETLSSFLVNTDAHIIREESATIRASQLEASFITPPLPLGPILNLFCRLYPDLCKKGDHDKDNEEPTVSYFLLGLGLLVLGGYLGAKAIDKISRECRTVITGVPGDDNFKIEMVCD